jgi:hypothetical protein
MLRTRWDIGPGNAAERLWGYGSVLSATKISPLTIASVNMPSANRAIARSAKVSSAS